MHCAGCHEHDLFGGRARARGWTRNLRETGADTRPSTTIRSEQRMIVAHRRVIGPPAVCGEGWRVACGGQHTGWWGETLRAPTLTSPLAAAQTR